MFTIYSPKTQRNEAELLRENNMKEMNDFITSLLKDPEYAEAVDAINSYKEMLPRKDNSITKSSIKKRSNTKDEAFKFFGRIPSERRKSSRLQNIAPLYSEEDLIDETVINKRRTFNEYNDDSDYEDIEKVAFAPTKKRKFSSFKNRTIHVIIPVEDVSEELFRKVVKRVSDKQYSATGSSCHQCRQKTDDQKTCCRNVECIGVRGQFCGVCLENRYMIINTLIKIIICN